jgi:hypothetical protein
MTGRADEALAVVLRSPHPSRFRLLTVVCVRNHWLAYVYQTAIGPVAAVKLKAPTGRRETTFHGRMLDVPVVATCKCRSATLTQGWILEQLDAGRRRAVFPD